ncbi:hypothetical protein J3E69DRAFT_343330 [Trichoderma sp. SZMC 28015]
MDASMVDFSDEWASWQISEYCNCTVIHAAAANPGPSLNTTSHTLPWLPIFSPRRTQRGSIAARELPEPSCPPSLSHKRSIISSIGYEPEYCTYETHACSAPPLFYFFTASLSQLHFQWHAKATPGHPLSPYSASSPYFFSSGLFASFERQTRRAAID